MSAQKAHWHTSREVVKRIVIQGKLVLETPTQLGNGETLGPTDMNLLRDSVDNRKALLTGTSIAGALRSYLREVRHGYENPSAKGSPVLTLFGMTRGDDTGTQSLLIVDDARSQEPAAVEIRDGVCIDSATGTAKDGAKFDMELLQVGTTFPLRFELLIPQYEDEVTLKRALTQALHGFEVGEIPLGARKRRGFGRCRVQGWQVTTYDLTSRDGILAWLREDEGESESKLPIDKALGVQPPEGDARKRFTLDATFSLDGSLLIRAEAESGADAGHLRSHRPGKGAVPILPGTSLAGVLRHRALRIANTLAIDEKRGPNLINKMFGSSKKDALTASRVAVQETEVENVQPLVQTRVKIDRFTSGAYPTALFREEPIFGGPDSRVKVKFTLRNPEDHEVGLLLLLLKDLWTGDLPVGGESSVGRGRLRGIKAQLDWSGKDSWKLSAASDGLRIEGDQEQLEKCVGALQAHLKKEVDDGTAT
ncbi:MAG: RAMP superfamily CRISPR-associated protein [Chloroflexota bacterium]|nr:RAMP superfamily CRISPR-associated protein [Chloroflexota bacterium]